MKRVFLLLLAANLFGCATYRPVPEGYAGAVARITDSGYSENGYSEGGSKGQLFALTEINGNRIMNSFWASANASRGQGFALTVVISDRQVPAEPMKATLRASHTTGAPIHAIASQLAGTFHSVEGTVDFSPKPNGKYVVKGELKKGGSAVWIEDADTGEPATEKIVEK
ncbi:MAG TPA: hypothetical protein VJ673_21825 [Aromatoleum sp.]|uniref:hypothetical protein n=1 Tax=Aromatoleum sp. TaxID=2307007 RepID=UPI002B4A8327|nr:hypothetical protein [Aromatoleum sp.]HJV28331.1 hypothetical protein [Aromatoleum sp.]